MESEKKDNFHFRVSQIAALALILSIIAVVVSLVDFVGLSPWQIDVEHKIDKLMSQPADIALMQDVVRTAVDKQVALQKSAQVIRDLESVVKDEALLQKIKEEIKAGGVVAPAPAEKK